MLRLISNLYGKRNKYDLGYILQVRKNNEYVNLTIRHIFEYQNVYKLICI